jgi:hypothetical protein
MVIPDCFAVIRRHAATEIHGFKTVYLTGTEYALRWYTIAPTIQKPIPPLRHTFSKPPISPAPSMLQSGISSLLVLKSLYCP